MNVKMIRATKRAQFYNRLMQVMFWVIGIGVLCFLLLMTGYIIINGLLSIFPGVFGTGHDGIMNQLFNTIYLVFLSLLVSVPFGIGAGIYISEYAKKGKMLNIIMVCIESLSSLPSVVVGLFGYFAFILLTHMKWNLFAGALCVSILSLPLITTTTMHALNEVPVYLKEGSYALGATKFQTIRKVLLPYCASRILTGVIMAAGRGFGEAAALLYTAGQSTVMNWNQWNPAYLTSPLNPFRPGETLALHIWVMRTEGLNAHASQIANVSAMVLVLMALFFNVVLRTLITKYDRKKKGSQ